MEKQNKEYIDVRHIPLALQAECVETEGEDLSVSEDRSEAGVLLGGEQCKGEAVRPHACTQQPAAPVLCVQDG